MRRFAVYTFVAVGAAALAYVVFAGQAPCVQPIEYAVGSIDGRFGVTQTQVEQAAHEAVALWTDAANKPLFVYEPEAALKINLIFDQRQQDTQDEKLERQDIGETGAQYEKFVQQHTGLKMSYSKRLDSYESLANKYKDLSQAYDAAVEYWNTHGGAPEEDYNRMQQDKLLLNNMYSEIEKERKTLNVLAQQINSLGAQIGSLVTQHNTAVSDYNNRFGVKRQFEQGEYIPGAITVYQFRDLNDLTLVMAHEFGHALGLKHLDDPQAVMYYLMDRQNRQNIALSATDKAAVIELCRTH